MKSNPRRPQANGQKLALSARPSGPGFTKTPGAHQTERGAKTAGSGPTEAHPRTLARRAALRELVEVEAGGIRSFSPRDTPAASRGFARELVGGVLRWQARLDYTLAPQVSKGIHRLDAPVRAALRLALYEFLQLETPLPALANEYAGLMRGEKLTSATGFVNAVVRRLPAQWRAIPADWKPQRRLATEFSHPQWLVERWLARLGAGACEALLRANNQVAPLCLRVNTLKVERDAILAALGARGLECRAGTYCPDAIMVQGGGDPTEWPEWNSGQIIAQDEAAQLVAWMASPQDGWMVVDAASAPGGKTTHLAQRMGDRGRIIACDSAPGRLKLVEQNAVRLGLASVETRAGDFRELAPVLARDLGPTGAGLVLLDAPCSGTGTLRRRPDARWRKTTGQLQELLTLQRQLLDSAAQVVRPGGLLVYSTCSLEAEENQEQVLSWLQDHPEFVLDAAPAALGALEFAAGMIQTWPHLHGCDGMFAARLRRNTA